MTDISKITEEELKSLQENVGKLNEVYLQLGKLENDKHKILHQMGEIEKLFDELQKEMEDKYGKVSINLDNGEFTKIQDNE